MVTRNKHDVIRERRLRQKLARVENEWTPKVLDQSWMRYAKCKLCKEKYCVNNNIHHIVDVHRVLGIPVCPVCFYRRGTKRLIRIHKLGKQLAQVNLETLHDYDLQVSTLIREAKELFGE